MRSSPAWPDDPAERARPRTSPRRSPTWRRRTRPGRRGDVRAKAEALIQLDVDAARAIVLDNGDWDGGLADLPIRRRAGIPTWIVRGDPAAGGYLPDAMLPALAARVGADHVLTLAGAPHAPQRTHPEATTLALLRALG